MFVVGLRDQQHVFSIGENTNGEREFKLTLVRQTPARVGRFKAYATEVAENLCL